MHHGLVHEGGFTMSVDSDGRFQFYRPDGERLAVPAPRGPTGLAAAVQRCRQAEPIEADAACSRWNGERPDWVWIMSTMMYAEERHRERLET